MKTSSIWTCTTAYVTNARPRLRGCAGKPSDDAVVWLARIGEMVQVYIQETDATVVTKDSTRSQPSTVARDPAEGLQSLRLRRGPTHAPEGGVRRGWGERTARTLSFWCFNSGVAMRDLLKRGVRSVVLTSGTLAPLPPLAIELQTCAPALGVQGAWPEGKRQWLTPSQAGALPPRGVCRDRQRLSIHA